MRAFPLGEHAEGERDYASTVRSASLHPRRRRLIVSARDRRGMGRVGGRGSGRVAVSRAARRASSGAVDRPRGFVRNEIVRLITVLLRVVSVVQIKVARAPSAGRPETPHARGGAAETSVSEIFSSAWSSLPSARFAVESSSVECSSKRDSPSSALTWRQESIRDLAGHSPRFVNRQT